MRQYFLLGLIIISWFSPAMSQNIDSLRNLLPTLKDTSRIDALHILSYFYILAEQKDSAEHYATIAYAEAQKQQYHHGIALFFLRKAQIAKYFKDDFLQSESFSKQSLHWYEKTGNKAEIDTAYHYMIYSTFAQSKFEEAIYYANQMYARAHESKNSLKLLQALSWMFDIYRQSGDYEKSFFFAQRKYELALKTKNKLWIASSLYGMAQLYAQIEDYPKALTYFRKVLQMDDHELRKDRVNKNFDIWFKMEFAEVFSHLHQFDSAWYYYRLYKPAKNKDVYWRVWWVSTGECYLLHKDYDKALQNFQLGLAEHKKLNDRNEVMRTLLNIGKTYLVLHNNAAALKYGREGLEMALQTKSKQFIRDGFQILSTVYDRLHQTDSANFYFRKYITMKEEVLNDQTKAKLAAYDFEQKIALLDKERFIHLQQLLLHQQKLKQKSLITRMLIGVITGILLLSMIILRNIMLKRKNEAHRRKIAENELHLIKLESEKTKAELQQQAAEMEVQALRAQMNPHFIFNCLNSINNFILQNEPHVASNYLIKFSDLIRMVLEHSQKKFIPLGDELYYLELYIQLEQLRLSNRFSYQIRCNKEVDVNTVMIPSLMLQPFVENAIWHGLMPKKEKGMVCITIEQDKNFLICMIEDNGIGRQKAALMHKGKSEKSSLGLQITQERIDLLGNDAFHKGSLTIVDLKDGEGKSAGTKVQIMIPVIHANVLMTGSTF